MPDLHVGAGGEEQRYWCEYGGGRSVRHAANLLELTPRRRYTQPHAGCGKSLQTHVLYNIAASWRNTGRPTMPAIAAANQTLVLLYTAAALLQAGCAVGGPGPDAVPDHPWAYSYG